ncbi:MAG: aldehyde dehydrogenase family protein, partial [Verrucomicrobiota bacterium]
VLQRLGDARFDLFRIARLIQEKARELAVIETLDGGKPIAEARGFDLPQVAAHFFYYAGWADKLDYAFPGRRTRPVGVCGQIVPWNFPLLMAAWKLAPALACGNCCVLKPAPSSSVSVLHLARIFQEAELPEGVVNILTGPDQTGRALVEHPDVNHLSFTGSTEAGREIARSVAATDKKLTLQLGGKAAHLIFEDAPIDQAIEGIVAGIFFNQGHLFHAGSRLLVQESILPVVVNKLRDRIARIRVGDPMDKNTDLGAIHSRRQLDRIRELVESAAQEGAEVIQPACVLPEKGCWFAPTLLNGVTDSHRVSREDIFGPVLGIMSFRTPEEAIELANHTPSGLSAGIWSDKGSQVFELIPRLRAGVVWANTYNQFDPASPFGGCKESGFGREGGLHGLAPYVELE